MITGRHRSSTELGTSSPSPVPPYRYLDRLRLALRPGGVLLVSTPNLHRLRSIALMPARRELCDSTFAVVGDLVR
jgi:hypothetical protein